MNFQDKLKALHQQAKRQAEAQRTAQIIAEKHKQATAEVDFATLMKDVIPLKPHNHYIAPPDKSPIKPRDKSQDPVNEQTDFFYIGEGNSIMTIPATFSKNGQGSNDIKRLQAGYWEVVADVDLHGYTQEQAQTVLNEFIEFVQQRGVCGEIIHGSGLGSNGYIPVLKSLVRRWLMQHPEVLAYCEPHKGNDGAVRILLKRRRKHDIWAE
ncbi:MAG: Smr/MutS family protein [Alysiella sp.]|uniref:Smr/MutS family protein n=1 Tax=Alysiella sp. TaxID=1872483 RepID=UPI0026DC6DDC|nr:Smr/MutS family protein [Alysiella sp.]MDO4434306.1 Smr/MutS family protein [Alysiella sp.]